MHLPDKKLHLLPSPHSFLHGLKFAAVSFGLAFGGFTHRLVDTLHILFKALQSCLHGLSAKTSSLTFLTITDFITNIINNDCLIDHISTSIEKK